MAARGAPCVLVDVDGTLLGGPSTEARFVWHLLTRRRIGLPQIAAAVGFALRRLPRHGRHVLKKNKAYLSGLAAADVAAEAERFVAAALRPLLRADLLARLAAHRAQGHRIVLLTGSPDFIAAPLARLVGADGFVATRCAERHGVFVADDPPQHPFAADKLALARQACRDHGAALEDAIAYADSIHDLPLLLQVGQPVAAWPDRALAAIARQGRWPILPGRQLPAAQPLTGLQRH